MSTARPASAAIESSTSVAARVAPRRRGAREDVLEVRASADEVGADIERRRQQGTVFGAGGPGDRRAGERHDLHVDHVGDALAGQGQRLDARQAVVGGDVGVGAHGAVAVARHQAGSPLGPLGGLLDGQLRPGRHHRRDRPDQIAGEVHHRLGEERLVEVGVRLDGGGQQQVAGEVDLLGVGGRAPGGRDRRDPSAVERDVDHRAVGERRAVQQDWSAGTGGRLAVIGHRAEPSAVSGARPPPSGHSASDRPIWSPWFSISRTG